MKLPKKYQQRVGAALTSTVERIGWRHFHVVGFVRDGAQWKVELVASIDSTVRLTIDARELDDRTQWSAGWVQLVRPKPA